MYANARSSAFMVGVNEMAVNTYACGVSPCSEIFHTIFVRIGWQAAAALAFLCVFAPNVLIMFHRMLVGRSTSVQELGIFRHNERHGTEWISPYYKDMQKDHNVVDIDDVYSLRNRKPLTGNEVKMV